MSKMLSWIVSEAKGVTTHHLERIGATVLASSFIFCVAEAYKNRKKRTFSRHYSRSQSLGALHGGKLAIQRILDTQHARLHPSVLDDAEKELKDLLAQESLHLPKLQSVVAKLEMSGKEETTLKILIAAQEKAEKNGRYQEAYELDMLIVEMFIYKGDLKEALKRKCLNPDQDIYDARRPLYKAIIELMQGETTSAENSWEEFKRIQCRFQWPDEDSTHSDDVMNDFNNFQRTVQLLDEEIKAVKLETKMEMIKATESLSNKRATESRKIKHRKDFYGRWDLPSL